MKTPLICLFCLILSTAFAGDQLRAVQQILNLNPAVKLTTKSEKSQSQKIRLKGTPTNWVKGFFLVKVNSILSVFVTLSLCV